ncbi:thermonuclease family protein [Paracoccus cavernae]|uniref:thermonuclease family protein n=1 Tax=Paracoccus cavernae TaxID=1571207 RepID=UPI0035F24808
MILSLATIIITGAVAIDGDTIRLDSPGKNLRLRIGGINAPEIKESGGAEASRALSRLVADETLRCDVRDVDHYGMPVVHCATERIPDIACEMVRQSHARDWPRYSKGAYADC